LTATSSGILKTSRASSNPDSLIAPWSSWAQTLLQFLSRADNGFDEYGVRGRQTGAKEEERTPGEVGVTRIDENLKKGVTNKTTPKKCNNLNLAAFNLEATRSRISSTSSTDEGISKTPKHDKNSKIPKITKYFQEKITDSVKSATVESASVEFASVESAYSSFRQFPNFSFEKSAFQKRLFKTPTTNNNTNIKSYDHWMSIQINDVILVEMSYNSLQKGKEAFNDFLDTCYDDDSVSKLVVYFNKTGDGLKTTFFDHGFRCGH